MEERPEKMDNQPLDLQSEPQQRRSRYTKLALLAPVAVIPLGVLVGILAPHPESEDF